MHASGVFAVPSLPTVWPRRPTPRPRSKLKQRNAEAGERASRLRRIWLLAENRYDRCPAGPRLQAALCCYRALWLDPGRPQAATCPG